MKTCSALILAILCAVSSAADDDQKCKNDFQSFLTCVKTEYQKKPASEKQAAKKEREEKANQCFSQAGCDPPNWDANPLGGSKRPGGAMKMPQAVQDCLKKKMVEKVGTKLNACLAKKGVSNVNFSAIADSLQGSGLGDSDDQAGKDGMQGLLAAKFNAIKGIDKCAQKKGGDTDAVKPLELCLHNIVHKDAKPKVCALTKPCEDKLTGECKKRGQDIRKALCECKKEKEKDVAKKLRDLGQKQKKVGIQDLLKTAVEDQDMQEIIQQVDACYAETKEPEPPLLKLALKLFSKGGGGGAAGGKLGAATSVNASTVIIMSDLMAIDADDQSDCQPCP